MTEFDYGTELEAWLEDRLHELRTNRRYETPEDYEMTLERMNETIEQVLEE